MAQQWEPQVDSGTVHRDTNSQTDISTTSAHTPSDWWCLSPMQLTNFFWQQGATRSRNCSSTQRRKSIPTSIGCCGSPVTIGFEWAISRWAESRSRRIGTKLDFRMNENCDFDIRKKLITFPHFGMIELFRWLDASLCTKIFCLDLVCFKVKLVLALVSDSNYSIK